MHTDYLLYFIKYLGINFSTTFAFYKILNISKKSNEFYVFPLNIASAALQCFIRANIPLIFRFIIPLLYYSIILKYIMKQNYGNTFVVTTFSLAISYIASLISIVLFSFILTDLRSRLLLSIILIILMAIFNFILVVLFFKISRFKNGFPFLKNDYLNLSMLLIASIIIFIYAIGGNHSTKYLASLFLIVVFITLLMLQKTFILYQKQKLQTQALKDNEAELTETKQKLQTALEEKEKLIKTNHEFYHRQEALKNKLNTILTTATSTEAANEYSNILDRINNLSQEYSAKLAIAPKLQSTNIEEIDDMLSYFQSECVKNNIEFIFKLDCNIDKIIAEHINKSDLETLLGDLLRNAIIAINNSSNTYKSIMLVFGLKDSYYQIDIYDSGVEFKIETLLKLGLEKASTYIGNGGTGIGMITTFETLTKTKASLIITEFDKNSSSYTKLLSIKFDKQNNYCINSPRADIIKKSNLENRNIITK